ncbi:hypothetical protein QYF36_003980 [Acer negundo]|nr:hypothetical protein QYF36_003980 [Acer negundo]
MASHSAPPFYVCLFSILHILTSTFAQSDNYIVYMDLSAMPKAFSGQHSWFSATLQSLSKTTTTTDVLFSSKLIYSYNHVINGFSASLTPTEHEDLKRSPGNSSVTDLPIVFMDQCHNLTQLRLVGQKIVVCEDKDGSSLGDQVDSISSAKIAGAVFISDYKDLESFFQTTFAAMFMNSKNVTRSSAVNCSTPSLDLNYPSFIYLLNPNDTKSESKTVQFQRTVTNVGEGKSTYTASVTLPVKGFKVNVVPDHLAFKGKYEKQSYKVSIEGPTKMQETVVFGYLSWAENGGNHVVNSPIVVTKLQNIGNKIT